MFARMPRRFLRGNVGRLAFTILAVACGVALVCAIDLVNRAVYAAFVEVVDTMAGRSSLQVSAGDGALLPEEIANAVRAVPGVELAVPVVSSWAFTTDGSGEQLTVHGIDVANDEAIRVYQPAGASPALDDPIVFLNHRDSVVVTNTFAERHHIGLEDSIEVDTPTGKRRFTVRGLLAPVGVARVQGGNLLVMDIQAAELAFTQPGLVNRIDVVVSHDADVPAVRDAILGTLAPGLHVDPPAQRRVDLHRVMRSVQTLLQAVGVFGLFAAFLITYSRLATVFEARVTQLAVLRAVGVRAGIVWLELLQESVLIAVAGIAVGVPGGIALGHVLLPAIATSTAIGANLGTTEAVVTARPESIVFAAFLGVAAVLCAAIVPARRAAAVSVVDVLRQRHVDRDDTIVSRRLRLAIAAVAAGLLGLHLVTGSPAAGLAATAAIVASVAALTRPLVSVLAGPLASVGPRLGGVVSRFAIANLFRLPRRTALTVATIGIGLGTVVWLWTLARSFEQSVLDVMPGVIRGDLVVSSANVSGGYIEAPLDDALLAGLSAVEGVASTVGEQTAEWHYADGPIAINAFDPRYFQTSEFGDWRLVGRTLANATDLVAGGRGVLVSENFVRNLDARVGDLLTLDTPTGPMSLRIAGVTADFLSPRGTVIMSRETYRRAWRDTHITHALVRVSAGASHADVRSAIERALGPKYRIRVLQLHELIDWFAAQVRRAFAGLNVLATLVIVVVLVGVGDALAAGMLERTHELGVARAVGIRRRTLGRLIVAEAIMLGVLGVLVAVVLGLGLGVLWVEATFPALLGWTLSLHIPLTQTGELAAAALAISLLAAYLPTVRAVRLDPVAALRTE